MPYVYTVTRRDYPLFIEEEVPEEYKEVCFKEAICCFLIYSWDCHLKLKFKTQIH